MECRAPQRLTPRLGSRPRKLAKKRSPEALVSGGTGSLPELLASARANFSRELIGMRTERPSLQKNRCASVRRAGLGRTCQKAGPPPRRFWCRSLSRHCGGRTQLWSQSVPGPWSSQRSTQLIAPGGRSPLCILRTVLGGSSDL